MNTIQAIILGLVQGLTEFLPVSSSGHLVIFQHIFGIKESSLTFDVWVHMGTLVAVFIAFWPDIVHILRKPFSKLTLLIVVGCIPAALMGFFFEPLFTRAFESLLVVGIGLLFTGFILMFSERRSRQVLGGKEIEESSIMDALFIGLLQGIAIVPGISRSGSTIAGGLLAGLDRNFAARFSFLLSIPVILGAGALHLNDVWSDGIFGGNALVYLFGFLSAALSGYIAIKVVMKLVRHGRLSIFSYYCWTIGVITLLVYFF